MNTDKHGSGQVDGRNRSGAGLKHAEITDRILGVFYEVYNELGYGFLESVYEAAMEIALRRAGLRIQRQWPIQVRFRGEVVGEFRCDFLVEDVVIVELKAIRALEPSQDAQTLNYLRATEIEVALLLNFGPKPQQKRFLFDNARKNERGVVDNLPPHLSHELDEPSL